jgi:Bacterial Ig-like domain
MIFLAAVLCLSVVQFMSPAACSAQITSIATIQANPSAYTGQVVTVEAQVYIPSNYRGGTTYSGYIQDGSGRGINVYGTGANDPLLQNTGNIVSVTGEVDMYFTTVEILNITNVTLISSGNAPLTPAVLSTGAAASSSYEGTFIQVSGPITAQAVGGPGVNYTINDGSGPIVVRVVDTLGAPSFTTGTTITARGAGGQFSADYQVNVGLVSDVFEGGGGPDTTPPGISSASAASTTSVVVNFSEPLESVSAQTAGNYGVYQTAAPGNTVSVSSASLSGSTVTLTLGSALTPDVSYTVTAEGVMDLADNEIEDSNTATFTYTESTATPIATIQANPSAFDGQVVTVEAQVYIPSNYRGGTTYSGYIQDGSGRGINVFGSGANDPLLQNTGNIVSVTGSVTMYFSTVEIENITDVTLISSGNAPLTALQLSTGAAASSSYEGTYIEVSGPITAQAVGGPGVNYTINDGSGPIVVRVVDSLSAPSFTTGTTITARGAGGQFSPDYQVNVGLVADVFEGGGGEDTTPPTVVSANAGTDTAVQVSFSEALDATTAGNASNYSVYETATPANTVAVSSASLSGANVTLTLGASLTAGTGYTVAVTNVEDAAGNVIAGSNTASFTYTESTATPIATIQANPSSFDGQVVTVRGQVYVPANYRGGTTYSGYIQDDSGRGINLFGSGANDPLLNNTGNIVEVTGSVTMYFTTVEIENITSVTLVSSGNTPLAPLELTTGAAASSSYEGTFIQVTGPITAQAAGGPGMNYTVNDGSGPIIVRVVDTLGAPSFANGTTITARGAGGQFSADYQVNVGLVTDIFEGGGGPDILPPTIVSVLGSSDTAIQVNFNEVLGAASAATITNYTVYETATPTNTLTVTAASLSGTRVTLTLGSAMTDGTSYTVSVTGILDLAGNAITGSITASFSFVAGGLVTIADIQADPAAYDGVVVTVQGQVFIPANYRGTTTSGYLQDSSGRGINVFGSGANDPMMMDVGNIVQVTGSVTMYFTTVEIENITNLTLISSGNDPLEPEALSTGEAADSAWEGTYIQVSGQITSQYSAGGAVNYTISDGSGPVVIRVADTINAEIFADGDLITAAGAGGQYQSDFQVLVGLASDIYLGGSSDLETSDFVYLEIPPKTFLPGFGEKLNIKFSTLPEYETVVRVFDMEGRLVKSLYDTRYDMKGFDKTVTWDGRNSTYEYVKAGTYIVHLSAIHEENGKKIEKVAPAVVATRLSN